MGATLAGVGWQLIECIDPDRKPTIVWKDGQPRQWVSLAQLVRKDGVDAATITRVIAAAQAIEPAPFAERETTPLIDTVIDTRQGAKSMIAHQVVDPNNTVRGLLLWLGPAGQAPDPRPRAAGMLWGGKVYNSPDTYMLRASNLSRYGTFDRSDQFFNRVVRFPDLPQVVELCTTSDPDSVPPLLSRVTLLHDDQHLVNLQICARRHGKITAGLGLDITAWESPTMDPATVARLKEATPDGHSVAILSFPPGARRRMPAVVYWVSPPPEWMAYWDGSSPHQHSAELIHADDLDDLLDAFARLLDTGGEQVVSLRLRTSDAGWKPLPVRLSKYPHAEDRLCVMSAAFH